MRLEHPEAHKAEQGAIFNCVNVAGYEGCQCYGLVLTARCDLEHNKQSVVNYLPVVKFRDWAARSLVHLLSKRSFTELGQEITRQFDQKSISLKIRGIFPLDDIISREFKGKEQTLLLDKLRKYRLAQDVLSRNGAYYPNSSQIVRESRKKCDKVIEELIEQKLGEYYFLESVDINVPVSEGYVILLRSMQALTSELMARVVEGFDIDEFDPSTLGAGMLNLTHEPICMVTGVLRSPDIEHLAQQFANLFVRVGLEDQKQFTISQHIALVQSL